MHLRGVVVRRSAVVRRVCDPGMNGRKVVEGATLGQAQRCGCAACVDELAPGLAGDADKRRDVTPPATAGGRQHGAGAVAGYGRGWPARLCAGQLALCVACHCLRCLALAGHRLEQRKNRERGVERGRCAAQQSRMAALLRRALAQLRTAQATGLRLGLQFFASLADQAFDAPTVVANLEFRE